MAGALLQLEGFSLDGLDLPVVQAEIASSLKRTIHEYRRTKGGLIETHERGIYVFNLQLTFHTTLKHEPPYWPDIIDAVHDLYDRGGTYTLIWPTVGRVSVVIASFRRLYNAAIVSGEDVTMVLEEDEFNRFLEQKNLAVSVNIEKPAMELQKQALSVTAAPTTTNTPRRTRSLSDRSIFDLIFEAARPLFQIRGMITMQSDLARNRLLALEGLIKEADALFTGFNNPDNWQLLQALHTLWDAVIAAQQPPAKAKTALQRYVVTQKSTVSEIAIRLYGSTERTKELLVLNAFSDAMAVQAGTSVLYFKDL